MMSASRRARLGRYALWQLRDYAYEKGLATLFVGALGIVLSYIGARVSAAGLGISVRQLPLGMYQELLNGMLGMFVIVGILFATNGIVSDDRKHGYYKFFFAKPVGVPRFYAQKFLMNGIGFVLAGILMLLLFAALYHVMYVPAVPLVLGVAFVTLGGIGFLLSTFWRLDWLSLMLVYGLADVLWPMFAERPAVRPLLYLLPPVHKLSGLYAAAVYRTALPWRDIAWLTAYGLVCFVLALLVLRRREIAAE